MFSAPIYTQAQLSLLAPNEIPYPYSDEFMVYDDLKHQYRLTRKAFEEMGRNLQTEIQGSDPDKINAFLHAVQLKVYTKIYSQNRSTRNQLNYLIAKRGFFNL